MLTGSFKFPSLLSVAKYKSWYQAEQETCFRLTTFICNTTSSSSLSFFYSRFFFAVLNQADNLIINKIVTPIKAKKRKKILFANHYLTWCLWLCWFFFHWRGHQGCIAKYAGSFLFFTLLLYCLLHYLIFEQKNMLVNKKGSYRISHHSHLDKEIGNLFWSATLFGW